MGFLSSSLAQLQRSKRNYLFCLQIQHWTLELTGKQFHLCVCACLCVCLSQILSGQAKNNPNENQTIGRIMNISVFIVPQIASCSCKSISSLVFQDTPCETVWIGISTPPFFFFPGIGAKAQKHWKNLARVMQQGPCVLAWESDLLILNSASPKSCLRFHFNRHNINPLSSVLRILIGSEHRLNGFCPLLLPMPSVR